jgi:hypothetical protein
MSVHRLSWTVNEGGVICGVDCTFCACKYVCFRSEGQRKLPQGLTFLTCTREVSGSKHGHNTVYPEILRGFPQYI